MTDTQPASVYDSPTPTRRGRATFAVLVDNDRGCCTAWSGCCGPGL